MRIAGYDLARVLALAVIMVCHYCGVHGGKFAQVWHDLLGELGNALFFVLSGCCLGMSHERSGWPGYGAAFLKRRALRLYKPFAIFIAIYVTLLYLVGKPPTLTKVALNFAMMPWFAKLEGAGYLWFVTAMFAAYALAIILSRCPRSRLSFAVLTVGATGLSLCFWVVNIGQGYFIALMYGFSVGFLWGAGSFSAPLEMAVAAVCITLSVFLHGSRNLTPWLSVVAAIAIIGMCRKSTVDFAVVRWLSGISYEVYLVHSLFVFGTIIPLKTLLGDGWLFVVNYVACSLICAYALNKTVAWLDRRMKHGG